MKSDFFDMLSALSAEGAEYLVVGAYALSHHGVSRATGDLDIWVHPTVENEKRVRSALRRFGAPVQELDPGDLQRKDVVLQIGVAPVRIDLLTSLTAVEFEEAWEGRSEAAMGDIRVPILGREHLIRNKRAVARPQDLLDADLLERGEEA